MTNHTDAGMLPVPEFNVQEYGAIDGAVGPSSEDESSASSFIIHSTLLKWLLSVLSIYVILSCLDLVTYMHLPLPTSSTAYPALCTLTDSPEHTTLPTFSPVPFHMDLLSSSVTY